MGATESWLWLLTTLDLTGLGGGVRGGLSVARWVDTIPFKETREYVRAVLAYNVIYSLKAGVAVEFLSESELAPKY